MKEIILASSSPRRKELLGQLIGSDFEIIVGNFEEDNDKDVGPVELAKEHALGKTKDVAKNFLQE